MPKIRKNSPHSPQKISKSGYEPFSRNNLFLHFFNFFHSAPPNPAVFARFSVTFSKWAGRSESWLLVLLCAHVTCNIQMCVGKVQSQKCCAKCSGFYPLAAPSLYQLPALGPGQCPAPNHPPTHSRQKQKKQNKKIKKCLFTYVFLWHVSWPFPTLHHNLRDQQKR